MTYRVEFSSEAEREIKKLENSVVDRILGKLEECSENPFQFFERLVGREDYKLRVGDYRIVAKIMHSERVILVISLGHRKNVYKSNRHDG